MFKERPCSYSGRAVGGAASGLKTAHTLAYISDCELCVK